MIWPLLRASARAVLLVLGVFQIAYAAAPGAQLGHAVAGGFLLGMFIALDFLWKPEPDR